ncbi:hypothetical protein M501DRAFT_1001202 [Patellaria atrata CBS 101060]|uniref:Uncharacterized protein n=1 Tax=Patellaria atrata CBS 101060 TaxID=1346257 RepID=A0A9P4VLR8_9PEZI|nr:hypothetical protein M501DRAFT_1001202 [Patellaria atrata CBS 101060]
MTWQNFVNRRNVSIFVLLSLGGSYAILKARTLSEKRKQRLQRDYSVHTSRSGGGI